MYRVTPISGKTRCWEGVSSPAVVELADVLGCARLVSLSSDISHRSGRRSFCEESKQIAIELASDSERALNYMSKQSNSKSLAFSADDTPFPYVCLFVSSISRMIRCGKGSFLESRKRAILHARQSCASWVESDLVFFETTTDMWFSKFPNAPPQRNHHHAEGLAI